ncbi:MAG: single-stranded DNA-binding protein [Peptoniphilus lacydonensis]|uniref:single-stranded DNA-binding protein n=1 Tax=Peptoniphilus lacydonensis TaxID=1673725 RepID=UPI0028FE91AC|nr:single-stranded DNA-binding protein [Peptoniphilus lacydonensis]MDU1955260.1 single-stranded DNA-binding protein [Peptoniphilus lacydonensis]
MKFDKDGFNEFIQDEFSFDGATQRIINNLVEYGIKNLRDSEDKLVDFIQTIINDPTVEEIKQFVINEEKEELIGGILMDVRKGNVINTEFGETIVLDIKDNQATLFDGNQFILATGIKLNKKSGNYEWESVRYASDIKTIANMQNIDFKSMKNTIDFLAEYNHKEFVKGIVSLETGVLNEEVLNATYDNYMSDSVMGLIDEKFMDYIDEQRLEENLEINREQVDKESKDILNIDGNLASDIEIKDLKAKDGRSFKVASFSIAENDKEGNVKFTDCYAYDDKISQVDNMKKGDFVHLFGKGKTNKGKNGKEYRSIKIYSAKLLKAKEQIKTQNKDKKSIFGQINRFKSNDNKKTHKIEHSKGTER